MWIFVHYRYLKKQQQYLKGAEICYSYTIFHKRFLQFISNNPISSVVSQEIIVDLCT